MIEINAKVEIINNNHKGIVYEENRVSYNQVVASCSCKIVFSI